ncbi:MAG: UDP-3-O-(3-hydroxymyristoyl)glucosamine N-acyltransferase [Bdellovibrio sp.]|nr:MAG: UDP-3-O-(3-hydroxymyristoyl)glucosamine N-acyltransferase [Bdellovibrio sp.]
MLVRVSAQQILDQFPQLLKLFKGTPEASATQPSSIDNIQPESLVFVPPSPESLEKALQSQAQILVVPSSLTQKKELFSNHTPPCILTTPNSYLAMALVNHHFFPIEPLRRTPADEPLIHPSAHIHPSATIGKGVSIRAGATVGPNVIIENHCIIGENAVIDSGAYIGHDTHIHPLVFVAHHVRIGAHCEVHPHSTLGTEGYGYAQDSQRNSFRIPHYGTLIIEDHVHIGAGVHIDRGTFENSRIGAGTKIDNHCHIGHNNQIGKNCLITAGFISAGSAKIGNHCIFGGRCSVNGHISITDNCIFAPLSAITNNITKPGKYGGYPVIDFNEHRKSLVLVNHLPQMKKTLNKIKSWIAKKEGERL